MHEDWPMIGEKQDATSKDVQPDNQPDGGKVYCPTCGSEVPCVATSYGWRACCSTCRQRWTRIRGEAKWTPEVYSPMLDNCGGLDV